MYRRLSRLFVVFSIVLAALAAASPANASGPTWPPPGPSSEACGVIADVTVNAYSIWPGLGWYSFPAGTILTVELTASNNAYMDFWIVNGSSPYDLSAAYARQYSGVSVAQMSLQYVFSSDVTNVGVGISSYSGGLADFTYKVTAACPTDEPETSTEAGVIPAPDDRINWYMGTEHEIAVYAHDGAGNPAIRVLSVDGDVLLRLSELDLAALPDMPEENIEIGRSADGLIRVYKLTTGEYQVNYGPNDEGVERVLIFDGFPPSHIYGYEIALD